MKILKINRDKARASKKGLIWCGGCDANLISPDAKCSVCGKRNTKNKNSRLKKDILLDLID